MRKPCCAQRPRPSAPGVPSPARKPGTRSTGSPVARRAAPGVRRAAAGPALRADAAGRSAPGLGDHAALAQHRGRRGPAKPSGSRKAASVRGVTTSTVRPATLADACDPGSLRVASGRCGSLAACPRRPPSRTETARGRRSPTSCSRPVAAGIELCYQTFGDPDDEPLLLVMGLGGPMTWWDPELCRMLGRRAASTSSATTTATPAGPSGSPGRVTRGHAGPGLRRPARAGAVLPARTWPPTPSGCSTTSASSPPTSSGCRWAA